MPRIYKGTTAKLALMYYPCVINPSDVSELTIAIYSEGTNEAIEYSLADITLKDNIAFINLAKYQLDVLDNGVIKYVARGVYKGNEFVQDRYSNYYIQTPKDYVIEDVAIQDIKRVDVSELITNVLPDSGYDGMGEVIVDANPLINNVADNAVTLDVDKNGTYVAELADNYKGYIKEINVSVPSVNVEQLTQEEYDNITPAKDILYLISDAIPEYNLKTINGETLVGEGDIVIDASNVDLSDYYTKGETDNKYQPKGNYLTSIPEEYVTDSELTEKGYATEQWVEEQEYAPLSDVNYLGMLVSSKQSTIPDLDEIRTGAALGKTAIQQIPSEYITETELNDALANIGGGSDIPYVVIKYANPSLNVLSGDLDAVVNAIKNNKPYLAYFYNTYSTYGQNRWLYQFTLCYADNTSFSLSYHTEISSVHKDIIINGSFDNTTQKYKLGSLAQTSHNYITSIPSEYITETELNDALANVGGGNGNIVELTQEEYNNITPDEETLYLISDVAPKENLKTINGESIIGTGDIVIESNVDLTGYATEQWVNDKGYAKLSYVDEQLGNVNNILENIIG
jgi:hypothetical protein